MAISKGEFIEIEYTGSLEDGTVFDTTSAKVAKESGLGERNLHNPVVCVGEAQLLPGLDKELEGKELNKEYSVTLEPEAAFGKRDVKKIKIIPSSTFKQHDMKPQQGLRINVDGEEGLVTRVAGGRVIVNFNHPLSGRKIIYTFTITRKVEDAKEKIASFLAWSLRIPADKLPVTVEADTAKVTLPGKIPDQILDLFAKKIEELTNVKVTFDVDPNAPKSEHVHDENCTHE